MSHKKTVLVVGEDMYTQAILESLHNTELADKFEFINVATLEANVRDIIPIDMLVNIDRIVKDANNSFDRFGVEKHIQEVSDKFGVAFESAQSELQKKCAVITGLRSAHEIGIRSEECTDLCSGRKGKGERKRASSQYRRGIKKCVRK